MIPEELFDWRRDVGNVHPREVQDMARHSDQTLEDFARDFLRQWPFHGEPTEETVKSVVDEVQRQPEG